MSWRAALADWTSPPVLPGGHMASNGTSRRPLRAPWRGLATSLLAASAALSLFAVEGRASAQETLGAPTIGTVTAAPVSLTVNWSAPSQTGSSTITAYDIRYILTSATDRAAGNWTLEEAWAAGGSTLRHAVTGLRDSTSYDIQVRAVAASDDGPWSTPATAGTTTDHGGTTSAATPLALGSSAAGRIDLGGDADVFSLVVPARYRALAVHDRCPRHDGCPDRLIGHGRGIERGRDAAAQSRQLLDACRAG